MMDLDRKSWNISPIGRYRLLEELVETACHDLSVIHLENPKRLSRKMYQ